MDKKKMSELISAADDETLKKIADSHAMISDDKKEELYARIVAKTDSHHEYADRVSGVEVRRGRGASRFVGFAAALALVLGGLGGGGLLLKNRMGAVPSTELDDSTEVIEVETEAATDEVIEEETEAAADYVPDYDYESIARDLTDRFIDGESVLMYHGAECDYNDTITFSVWDDDDEEWSQKYGGERTFCKVTDERFSSCQDILDYYNGPIASSRIGGIRTENALDDYACVISWLGGDIGDVEVGSTVHFNKGDQSDTASALISASYIDYKGELYMRYVLPEYIREEKFSSEPVCYDLSENSFRVSRYVIPPYTDYGNMKYGEEKIYTVVLDNDEWKIDFVETGAQVEYKSAIGIQCYLEHKPEYNDIDIDCGPIMRSIEVTSYDPEKKIADVHGVLKDVNGTDAIEITATCAVGVDSFGVGSAEITRLNEYDGTLKRPTVIWAEKVAAGEVEK